LKSDDAGTSVQSNLSAQQSLEAAQSLRAATAGDAAGTRALHHPVGSSAWADELGTRMTLMADRGQHSASLRLSPEHLGPLEVRIAIRDDQASVWFGAAHADTRAAIEQALPRLRELFASHGMSLADAGVFQDAPREQPRLSSGAFSPEQSAAMEADAIAQIGPIRLGLVDAYA
jgi:flagellar hook-length control protein FliK